MIVATVMVIRASRIFVTMIHIRMLHIAAAAAPDIDAGMIAALDHYMPASIEPVVNVHAAPVVMEPGDMSIRAPGNGAMGGLHSGVATRGGTAMSTGRTAVARDVAVCAARRTAVSAARGSAV
jgi:hypothetical protein